MIERESPRLRSLGSSPVTCHRRRRACAGPSLGAEASRGPSMSRRVSEVAIGPPASRPKGALNTTEEAARAEHPSGMKNEEKPRQPLAATFTLLQSLLFLS